MKAKIKPKRKTRTIEKQGVLKKSPKDIHNSTREPTQIGYMRVSTEKQDHALQHDALTSAGVDSENIFQDTMTGSKVTREGLQKCLKYVIKGDTIVVWKIDRFSRNTRDMLEMLEGLEKRGVSIKSITQPFDTSTPGGKMMLQLLAIFAEFERETIRERVIAGIRTKREANKKMRWGRKPQEDYDPVEIRRLNRQGMNGKEIARQLGISRATVSRAINHKQHRKAKEGK